MKNYVTHFPLNLMIKTRNLCFAAFYCREGGGGGAYFLTYKNDFAVVKRVLVRRFECIESPYVLISGPYIRDLNPPPPIQEASICPFC